MIKSLLLILMAFLLGFYAFRHLSPPYLYRIVSMEQWEESQKLNRIPRTSIDSEFFHLMTEEQTPDVVNKYWNQKDHIVLKLDPQKLKGRLVKENNPGGTAQYYHLYEGEIPLDAVIEIKVIRFPSS